ncbi:MAG TPA: beta-galactosidase trimerization domain-containing protein, partial [Armatimonadota bacterium]
QTEEFSAGGAQKEENLIRTREKKIGQDLSAKKKECEAFLSKSRRGYFEALTRAHVPFDIILDHSLTREGLSKYKTLVLPDATCLSDETAEIIKQYVADGGNLLGTYEAGFYDEIGNPSNKLMEVLGIASVEGAFPVTNGENYLQASTDHLGYKQGVMIERAPHVLKIRGTSDSKMLEQLLNPVEGDYLPLNGISSYPGVITHSYGKGKVAYFAEALGPFCNAGLIAAEDRVCKMLEELSGGFTLQVEAPRTVTVERFRQKDSNRVILHLVNNSVDGRPVREFLPALDIRIRVESSDQPRKVFALREGEKLESSYADGVLSIALPKLTQYEVIVLEY